MWGILFLISTIYAFYYAKKLQKTAKNSKGKLAREEVFHVLIPVIFSPILAGAIYYYMWKKLFPVRASQANKYSWIVFGAMLLFWLIRYETRQLVY